MSDPAAVSAEAIDKIAAARVWLLKEKPFFGVLARALRVEPSLAVPAFRLRADDRLLVNPNAVLALRFPALTARLAHLALHAALGAFARRAARAPLRWNVAHDLAVDPLLRAAGLPPLDQQSSESAARTSCDRQSSESAARTSCDRQSSESAARTSCDLPSGASAEQHYERLPADARPEDAWCDLADLPAPEDAPAAAPGGGDEPSPMEARARALQWRMRLAAALEEEIASGGKTFGERPGWIDDLVQATIEPPPSFDAILQRSIATLTRADRSFLRPSRRAGALAGADGQWPEIVSMPGRRVRPAGRLASVIDTSASIDAATLARFLGSLAAVATAEGIDDIRLIQADAEITSDEEVFSGELQSRKVAIVGRGGTDFGPALRMLAGEALWAAERWTVVYLTDLEGKLPPAAEMGAVDVLWVVPGKAPRTPPFGRVLEMPARGG